ncbi:ABC transporter ATP-binding protein [Lacrimispora sp.]|jgi:ABC-type multidrug transport system fused ATPase/permease subunit|uniref:ABC transporter ATP-binding protein n=1 Tax=Lacrimispora sp. TaxID=2719234 RepID=UPI0026CD0906|nr:ABC transporter ATP-binding protein [Lacrimispora sp.]
MSMEMNIKGKGPAGRNLGVNTTGPKSLWKSIVRLLGYMKKSGLLITVTLIVAIAGTVMQVITPKILGGATTIIFEGIKTGIGIDFNALLTVLAAVGALYLGVFLASFLQERLMTVVSLKTTETLRNAVKARLNQVPISYFDKHSTGDLMSVAVNDIDNVASNLQQSLTQLISSVILAIGTLAIMLTISPTLTLMACVMIPASILITKAFTPIAQKNNKKYVKSMGELNGTIEETYENFTVIKTFGSEQSVLDKFRKSNSDLCESGWKAKFFGQSMMHFMMLVQNGIYVLTAAFGAFRVMGGSLILGDLQAFLQYSGQFTSPISHLSMVWSNLLSAMASAERVFALLDAEKMEEYDGPLAYEQDPAKIVFDSVRFGYTNTPLMTDFSLQVRDGQMIAIVGHTGAGKTTLVNLLERFYEVQGGSIRIDGSDIRSFGYDGLRRRIGMVLQDTWLFSGTIYDNIKYGNDNATEEQVYAAAKAAFADDFIRKLPEGYDTVLGEGADNISQGQKQLITIARAFVADPEIIILDEATSNVDSRTEMVIQKAMWRLLKGRTSFVVAHRLSTIYHADNIVVMQNGDIVETGTHKELISKDGVYADIYNSQFSGKTA